MVQRRAHVISSHRRATGALRNQTALQCTQRQQRARKHFCNPTTDTGHSPRIRRIQMLCKKEKVLASFEARTLTSRRIYGRRGGIRTRDPLHPINPQQRCSGIHAQPSTRDFLFILNDLAHDRCSRRVRGLRPLSAPNRTANRTAGDDSRRRQGSTKWQKTNLPTNTFGG